MRSAEASWYGPGLWGNKTACGQTLRPNTLGVAHKTLPCGTTVKFVYHGHALITQVIDRGPYIKGRAWDLTQAASEALDLEGIGNVRYAVALTLARK
jgi:rare lipoprotein A